MDVLIKKKIQKKRLLQAKKKVKLEKEKKLQKKMFEEVEQERELARGKEREKEVNKFEILKYYRDEYPEASASELKKIIKTETGVDIPKYTILEEQPQERKQELIEKKKEQAQVRLKELENKKKEEQNALKQELQRQKEKEEMAKTKKSKQNALDEIERIKAEIKNIPLKYEAEKRDYNIAIKQYQEQLDKASAKKQKSIEEEASFKQTRQKNIEKLNQELEERNKQATEFQDKKNLVDLNSQLKEQIDLMENLKKERVRINDPKFNKKAFKQYEDSIKDLQDKIKETKPSKTDELRNTQNLQAIQTLIKNIEKEKDKPSLRSKKLIDEAEEILKQAKKPTEPEPPKKEDIDALEQRILELQGEAKMPEAELPLAEASDADLGFTPSSDVQLGDLNYDYANDPKLNQREKTLIKVALLTPSSDKEKQQKINDILDKSVYSQMQEGVPITGQEAQAEVLGVPNVPVQGQIVASGLKPTGKGVKFLQRYMIHPRDIKMQKGGQLKFTNRGKKHIKLLTKIHEPRRAGHIVGMSILNKLAKNKKKRVKAGGIFDTLGSIIGSIF